MKSKTCSKDQLPLWNYSRVVFAKTTVHFSIGKMEFLSQLWSASFLVVVLIFLTSLRRGLTVPWPGQLVVKPGTIILGYPGDPLYDDGVSRPDFTRDGSFMVFRKSGQSIPLFEQFIEANWEANTSAEPERSLTPDERKALFGARLFGRFKSVR